MKKENVFINIRNLVIYISSLVIYISSLVMTLRQPTCLHPVAVLALRR